MRKIELQTLKLLLLKFEEDTDKEMSGKEDAPYLQWEERKEIMQICMRIPSGYEDLLK